MSDQSQEIQGIFDNISSNYDQLNDWISWGQHRIWKLMTVKWAEPKPGDTYVDLCCGSGDLTRLLAEKVGTLGKVSGVDFAPQMLAIAKQKSSEPHIEWVEADVLDLPFADNTFDGATMGYGLRNVVDIPKSLKEIYRILKPGAKAAILDFHLPSQPLFRQFQQWYMETIVVPLASQQGLEEEYAYIWPSVQRFPRGPEQESLARQVGFRATHYPIVGGTLGVLVLTKPRTVESGIGNRESGIGNRESGIGM
ncbi:bifunctional demethylmenaquinone methyltransferase/2-methoxy-6-polyprenyl-1,4-benzoquinol methylase UbiE [Moorena producens JHB]|uniref:2-phytyl-1,4-naphtoquinone methyltransferase n=1 Tax=Moorena producens (strain JHB) TaxID=1454205 RepID=A0A1D9G1V4_MOOP1|nr:bifunctional demethylmenaquinone methyltransferase/2-methoxy-6-polyprenyl-1,4-benzoquinol methylase UbiE [Moorena producens]AOY81531.1 bifunctional demethylmenaquinone methyltransferase/2-methoxy-6-polyprenyl-1,4-benzoquinol methylase UbiE [Moorena producens JHB]